MEDRIQKLELKITELENKLKQAETASAPTIDPEDYKIYQKVSAQLGQQIFCAICRPRFCWPPLCICPCGPGFCRSCGPCVESNNVSNTGFSTFME